jgi:hypothetical protein
MQKMKQVIFKGGHMGYKMEKCKLKKRWVKMEMEHAHLFPKNRQKMMAKKIAKDHIAELGCGYYPALEKMEKHLRSKNRRKR